jgi:hypothetical protein
MIDYGPTVECDDLILKGICAIGTGLITRLVENVGIEATAELRFSSFAGQHFERRAL